MPAAEASQCVEATMPNVPGELGPGGEGRDGRVRVRGHACDATGKCPTAMTPAASYGTHAHESVLSTLTRT